MTTPLPKWIQTRYAVLWNRFKDKDFTFEQVENALKDSKGINVFLSDLKKAGWISIGLSEKDSRKRVYKLKNPENGFKEMTK